MTTIVRGAWLLTAGDKGAIRNGALVFEAGEILSVGPFDAVRREHPDADVVGDEFGIVTPGFVNTHTHLSEALVPGIGSDLTLFEWGRRVVTPAGSVLGGDEAREGALLKSIEFLHTGITTVNDMFHHYNPGSMASLGVVEGLQAAGMRGVVAFGAEDGFEAFGGGRFTVTAAIEEHRALAAAAEEADLIRFRVGVGTMLGSTDGMLEAAMALAADNGWPIHTHLAEVREETVEARARWGRNSVEHAAAIGLLDLEVIAAHLIWLTESDIELLAGHSTAAAHNPVANMILGSGVCRVPQLQAAGLRVGIGTDGTASNDSQNMLEAIKSAALLQKVSRLDPAAMTAKDVFLMATIGGAEALGLSNLVGSLEPGKRADVALFGGTVELANIHDPYQQLVYCTSPRSVSDVWVDGTRLLESGSTTRLDEQEQIGRARALAERVATESGLVANGLSHLCET